MVILDALAGLDQTMRPTAENVPAFPGSCLPSSLHKGIKTVEPLTMHQKENG